MRDVKLTGVQGVPDGVRLLLRSTTDEAEVRLTPADAARLATNLLTALNHRDGAARYAVEAEGLNIVLDSDRPGRPAPLMVQTLQGPLIVLDLSWSAAEKLTQLSQGFLRAEQPPSTPSA